MINIKIYTVTSCVPENIHAFHDKDRKKTFKIWNIRKSKSVSRNNSDSSSSTIARIMSRVTRVAGRMLEPRTAGVSVLDSGSSCSHIYYPGSRTGTNEFLIIRVGAGSIRAAVWHLFAPVIHSRLPATSTPFAFFHRSALYEKYGVTPDVKDFLVRRKKIRVPSLFLFLHYSFLQRESILRWRIRGVRYTRG